MKKFYRWEIALMVGILVGVLSFSPGGQTPETMSHARYQISVFPFAVGHGTEPVMVQTVPEPEMEIRYYFPELWEKIRDAIGL